MYFNHDPRKKNVIRSSVLNAVNYSLSLIMGLGYRMFFLRILTVEYLGIDGLFSNILGILGLAEMGITDAIIYRLYKPISTDDVRQVGALMGFFRRTYHIIALVILLLGGSVCPFLNEFINDSSTVPGDVNLYAVFLLLLIQSASTYLFSYKFSLLNADQKQYQTSIINTVKSFTRYTCQLLTLALTKNYTFTLVSGIFVTLVINWLGGMWVTRQYPLVFENNGDIIPEEKRAIYKDTAAGFLHDIGYTVVTSTDNILLTKFFGLAATGIYSNYALIVSSVSKIMDVAIGSIGPSFGNVHVMESDTEAYLIYKKALFLNFWIAGLLVCCLYVLIDDFVVLWLRKELFLDPFTVGIICLLFYIQSMRGVSSVYTYSSGLFTKDKLRPVIEAVLNIVLSVIFLQWIGTAGIFLGTIVSDMLTVFWRVPYLLYKYIFHKRVMEYWKMYAVNLGVAAGAIWLSQALKTFVFGKTITLLTWIGSGALCAAVYCLLHFLIFHGTEEFRYFWKLVHFP